MRKKAEVKKSEQQINHYKVFKDWLYNSLPDADLPQETIKNINPKFILCMFGSLGHITVYLNELCNNYETIWYRHPIEFYKFIKKIVLSKNIKPNEFSFYKHEKEDKDLNLLNTKMPYLKKYEITNLLKLMDGTEELNDLYETFGMVKYKKTKMSKTEINKYKNEKIEPTIKINKTNKISFNNWVNMVGGKIDGYTNQNS